MKISRVPQAKKRQIDQEIRDGEVEGELDPNDQSNCSPAAVDE